MPEDPETYRKRMETRHRNEEHKIRSEPGWTDDGRRTNMRYLQEKRDKANKEYQRRKAAAAASAGTGASAGGCDATYPDGHDAALLDGLMTVAFVLCTLLALVLASWARRAR